MADLAFTTTLDEERGVKCVHLGDHKFHECSADLSDEEIHAELADGFRFLLAQQRKQKRWINRLLASTIIAAFLFIVDVGFLVWHLELIFGGHEGGH